MQHSVVSIHTSCAHLLMLARLSVSKTQCSALVG